MRYFFFIICLSGSLVSAAQNIQWDLLISTPEEEILQGAVENSFGNYVLCGSMGTITTGGGYVIEVDPLGNIINSKLFVDSINPVGFTHIFEIEDGYLTFGQIRDSAVPIGNRITVKKLDYNLDEVWAKSFGQVPQFHSPWNVKRLPDSSFIAAGTCGIGSPSIMFYRFSPAGDSLMGKCHDFAGGQYGWDILDMGNGEYKGFTTSLPDSAAYPDNYAVRLDSNFNILSFYGLSEDIFPTYFSRWLNSTMSAKWLNDSVYMASGRLYWDPDTFPFGNGQNDIPLLFFNKNDSLLNAVHFGKGPDTMDVAANRSIDFVYPSAIYVGGMSFANQSWYSAYKFDSAGNMLWEKYYGGDNPNYWMIKMLATRDSGCLMIGIREDAINGMDIYIIKVGPDGVFMPGIETTVLPEAAYKVFPNPASGYFYIQGSFALPAALELYDMMGRKVYRQSVKSNKQQIKVDNLVSGMYIYRLLSDGKAGRGKIVLK